MIILIVRVIGWIISMTMAVSMTFGLFYFMQSLIDSGKQLDERITVIKIVDATMPEIQLVVIQEIDKPEPIAEISEQRPELQDKHINLGSGPSLNIERARVEIDMEMDLSIVSIAATDGDYLPLVAIAPQYPERARAGDIEGWCLVRFTVDARGSVVEDSIEVMDSEPPYIFDRASVLAAARFRFHPRIKNGVGVEVPGVQYLFRFVFDD